MTRITSFTRPVSTGRCLVAGAVLVAAGCTGLEVPISRTPTAPSVVSRLPEWEQRLVTFDEVVDVEIDATIVSGKLYCEIGNDPVPCARFSIDVPRAGTVSIRLDCTCDHEVFIEVGNLAVEHLGFVAGASPLEARVTVPAGLLPFRVGAHLPWGRPGLVVRLRMVATLQ